jgi:hypothetical protein
MQEVVLTFELHPEVAENRAIAFTPFKQDGHSCLNVLDKRTQNPTNFWVLTGHSHFNAPLHARLGKAYSDSALP